MKRAVRSAALSALSVAVLAACSDSVAPEPQFSKVGVIELEGYAEAGTVLSAGTGDGNVRWTVPPGGAPPAYRPPSVLDAPESVAVGQAFDAVVTTIGEGGCWSAEKLDVRREGRTIVLTPYDVHSGHEICTMILLYLEHRTELTFDEPGEWTIRVDGRRARYGDDSWETPVAAERTVVVH